MDQVTTGWVRASGPPSVFRHPVLRFKDRARFVFGRKSDRHFVRLFPNFGFRFTIGPRTIAYSRHRGFSMKTKG